MNVVAPLYTIANRKSLWPILEQMAISSSNEVLIAIANSKCTPSVTIDLWTGRGNGFYCSNCTLSKYDYSIINVVIYNVCN